VYDLHYNYVLNKFLSKKAATVKLLFTDTVSLAYSIETDDIYEDIKSDASAIDYFDSDEYMSELQRLGKLKDQNHKTGPIRHLLVSDQKCILYDVKTTTIIRRRNSTMS